MGSGKSSVGRALLNAMDNKDLELVDSDRFVENYHNLNIEEIFNIFGEEYFRRVENIFIDLYVGTANKIISSGGGLPIFNDIKRLDSKNSRKTSSLGKVFYLKCNFENIIRRVKNDTQKRPLLKNENKFRELFLSREDKYLEIADNVIDANLTVDMIVKNILENLK